MGEKIDVKTEQVYLTMTDKRKFCGSGECLFAISKEVLPIHEYVPKPISIVVGISQDGFVFPRSSVIYDGVMKSVDGWYNQVTIKEYPSEVDLKFTFRSSAEFFTIIWWFEEYECCDEPVEKLTSQNMDTYRYSYGLHWIPTKKCNFSCSYCCEERDGVIHRINIQKVEETLARHDGVGKFTITGGGEPFVSPDIIELCQLLAKENYIAFTTNGISIKLRTIAETIDPNRVDFIVASFHIDELEKYALVNRFIENVLACVDRKHKIVVQVIAHPNWYEKIDTYTTVLRKEGIDCTFAPLIGDANGKRYPESYSEEELNRYSLTLSDRSLYNQKGNLCNAGYNTGVIWPDGTITTCYHDTTPLGSVYQGFTFKEEPQKCGFDFCGCPLNHHDAYLYLNAEKSTLVAQR